MLSEHLPYRLTLATPILKFTSNHLYKYNLITMISPKNLRILFIDDEKLEIINILRKEGYDVEHWEDVDNLEKIVDGRYHIVFIDVRGIGEKYGGNGLDVLKYIGIHNPIIHSIIFSAKPFTGTESELIRKHAKRSMSKDCTFYEIAELLDEYSKSLTPESVINELEKTVKLGFFAKRKIRGGNNLSKDEIEKFAKKSGIATDAIKIVANTTTIAASIIKLLSGIPI